MRAVIRFDFEQQFRIAKELGLQQTDIALFVTKQFEDVIHAFSTMNPDDFIFADKNAVRTLTVNDLTYEVEIFDSVGIECPHCHASLLPLFDLPHGSPPTEEPDLSETSDPSENLAEPPEPCQHYMMRTQTVYPRSCPTCKLGPCKFGIEPPK